MLHHGALLSSESNDSRFSCIDYIGDLVAVGNARGAIFFYKVISKATRLRPDLALHVAPPPNDRSLNVTLTCIRFSPCQTYLAVGTASGTVLVFNLKDRSKLDIKCYHDDHRGKAISALCWSHDSSKLFSGCIGGVVIEFIFSENVSDWNSSASSTSAMALNFASALLMGKKYTTLICQSEEIVRQIECAFSDTCSCGSADILLVSVAHHSLLFQLPINKNQAPRFCDIPLHTGTNLQTSNEQNTDGIARETHFDELWCASAFYNSYTSMGVNNQPQIQATSIIIAQSCESGIKLVYCTLDGEVQEHFQLKGPYRARTDDGYGWESCCLGVRCLSSFNSNLHKHLMTLVTADNSVMLINLQDMSCDYLLQHFDYSIHAAVPNNGRVLLLYENVDQEMMMTDLLEVLTPTSAVPPLNIFDSHLYLSVTYMKRCWLDRKRKREREGSEDEDGGGDMITPALLSTSPDSPCRSDLDYDNGNAFLYYEPGENTENDIIGPLLTTNTAEYVSRQYTRTNSKKSFARRTESEKVRDSLEAGRWKKLDDLENDLNHALTACDEELETWAFNAAAAATSLSSLLSVGDGGGGGGAMPIDTYSNSHLELGGGGGGLRSLDEIAKYGAILSSQGVCLSVEAITQLSSLQQVLTSVDMGENYPRQQALVGVGYDFYGLNDGDEDEEKRQAVVVANRTRMIERKKALKNILAESYDMEDSIIAFRNSETYCQHQYGSCSNTSSSKLGRKASRDILFGAVQERGNSSVFSSNVSSANTSAYSLKSLLYSGSSSDKLISGCSIDAADQTQNCHLLEVDILPAMKDSISLINRIDRALENTAKVLNLKKIVPLDGVQVDEESINGTYLGYMKPITYSNSGDFYPFWMTLEKADEIIFSESLECSGSSSSPCSPSKHRFADRIKGSCSCSCSMRGIASSRDVTFPTSLSLSHSSSLLSLSPSPSVSTSIASNNYNGVRPLPPRVHSPPPSHLISPGIPANSASTTTASQMKEKKEKKESYKKGNKALSYSSSNGIGGVSNSTPSSISISISISPIDTDLSIEDLEVPIPPILLNDEKHLMKTSSPDLQLITLSLSTSPTTPASSPSPSPSPLLFPPLSDIISLSKFSDLSPACPSSLQPRSSSHPSSSFSSPPSPLLLSSPHSPDVTSIESINKTQATRRCSSETISSQEMMLKLEDSDKGHEEEDSGINPFTDSDISWMEWWWDLDRMDESDVLTHQIIDNPPGADDEYQVDPRSIHQNYPENIPESDPRFISDLEPESVPGAALKKRIMAFREERKAQRALSINESLNVVFNFENKMLNDSGKKKIQEYDNKIINFDSDSNRDRINNDNKYKKHIYRVVENIECIDSLHSLRQEEAPRNMYDVLVIAPKGLGLNLSLLPDGALMVRTFSTLENNESGPVEKSGFVRVGDYLIGINGLGLIGLGLEQIAEILQNLDKMGEVSNTIGPQPLYHIISYLIILYHVMSYHIISMLYHIISFYVILYHTIPYYIILYHILPSTNFSLILLFLFLLIIILFLFLILILTQLFLLLLYFFFIFALLIIYFFSVGTDNSHLPIWRLGFSRCLSLLSCS